MKKTIVFITVAILIAGCSSPKSKGSKSTNLEKENDYGLTEFKKLKFEDLTEKELGNAVAVDKKNAEACKNFEDFERWEKNLETSKIEKRLVKNLDILYIKQSMDKMDEDLDKAALKNNELLNRLSYEQEKLYESHLKKSYGKQVEEKGNKNNQDMGMETEEKQKQYDNLQKDLEKIRAKYTKKQISRQTTFEGKTFNIDKLEDKQDKEKIEEKYYKELLSLYKEKINKDKELANLLGSASPVEMYHKEYNRPYSQKEMENYFKLTKKYLVPAFNNTTRKKPSKINIQKVATDGIGDVFKDSNSDLFNIWQQMIKKELYDIAPTENKVKGWAAILGNNPPFMIGNFENNSDDLQIFIHEFGHFYAAVMQKYQRNPNNDVDEIYSQALEMLMSYQVKKIGLDVQENWLWSMSQNSLISMPLIQEFETLAYEEEDLTLEKVQKIAKKLEVEYLGKEDLDPYSWTLNIQIDRPLGAMEYWLGAITAVQLHELAGKDDKVAFDIFLAMLNNPNQTDIPKLTKDARLKDPTKEETVKEVADYLSKTFDKND